MMSISAEATLFCALVAANIAETADSLVTAMAPAVQAWSTRSMDSKSRALRGRHTPSTAMAQSRSPTVKSKTKQAKTTGSYHW